MALAPRHRRSPWVGPVLFIAFVVVPVAEIWVILRVGRVIGPGWTLFLLILDSLIGAWLVRREGARAWRALRTSIEQGKAPSRELADGALILLGGALMLSPGFITDVLGVLLVLPIVRPFTRGLLARYLQRRVVVDGNRPGPPGAGPVVRGDVVE